MTRWYKVNAVSAPAMWVGIVVMQLLGLPAASADGTPSPTYLEFPVYPPESIASLEKTRPTEFTLPLRNQQKAMEAMKNLKMDRPEDLDGLEKGAIKEATDEYAAALAYIEKAATQLGWARIYEERVRDMGDGPRAILYAHGEGARVRLMRLEPHASPILAAPGAGVGVEVQEGWGNLGYKYSERQDLVVQDGFPLLMGIAGPERYTRTEVELGVAYSLVGSAPETQQNVQFYRLPLAYGWKFVYSPLLERKRMWRRGDRLVLLEEGFRKITLVKPALTPQLLAQYSKKATKKVVVETGCLICDGHYIQAPYTLEARESAIYANGKLLEEFDTSRDELQAQQNFQSSRLITLFDLKASSFKETAILLCTHGCTRCQKRSAMSQENIVQLLADIDRIVKGPGNQRSKLAKLKKQPLLEGVAEEFLLPILKSWTIRSGRKTR